MNETATKTRNNTNAQDNMCTRDKILSAARSLFSVSGYYGTSIGQISAKASVNSSLIFHHFGSKKNLWIEIKDIVIEEGKAVYKIYPSLDQPVAQFLKELIERAVLFYKNNTELMRLINWQRLELQEDELVFLNLPKESDYWIASCQHYQEKGEVNPELNPAFIIAMILAVVRSIAIDPNIYTQSDENRKLYIDFCIERLMRAISSH